MGVAYGSVGVIPTTSSRITYTKPTPPQKHSGGGFLSILRIVTIVIEVVAAIAVSAVTLGAGAPEAIVGLEGGIAATDIALGGAEVGSGLGLETGEVLIEGANEISSEALTEGAKTFLEEGKQAIEGIATKGASEAAPKLFGVVPKFIPRGVGIGIQTGIGLAGGGANTLIDVAEGGVKPSNLAFNFLGAILPGVSELTSGVKTYIQTTRFVGRIAKGERAAAFVEAASQTLASKTKRGLDGAKALEQVASKKTIKNTFDVVRELGDIGFTEEDAVSLVRSVSIEGDITPYNLKKIAKRMAQETKISEEIATKKLEKINQLSEIVKELRIPKKASVEGVLTQIKGFTNIEQENLIRGIFKGKVSPQVQSFVVNQTFQDLIRSTKGNETLTVVFSSLVEQTKLGNPSQIRQLWKNTVEGLKLSGELDKVSPFFANNVDEAIEALFLENSKSSNLISRFVRYAGTKKFNDKIVQPFQAIVDPNDLGRYPVELVYGKLKDKITTYFAKVGLRKGASIAQKGLAKGYAIEQRLIDAGWKPIPSKYLMAIKVFPGGSPLSRVALVKFRPDTTQGTGAKQQGKKDVLISLSDKDLERLVVEGGNYWWGSRGKRKGWWFSRGGRKISGIRGAISDGLSLFLGFIPINALRNFLSLTSNLVETVDDIAGGRYIRDYIPKLERALIRVGINRAGRLASRVVIGGAASTFAGKSLQELESKASKKILAKLVQESVKKPKGFAMKRLESQAVKEARKKIGKTLQGKTLAWVQRGLVGREAQRLTSIALTSLEGQDSNGYFQFKTRGYANRITKKAELGILTSTRSNLLRTARRKGIATNVVRQISARRKFGIAGRTISAVTPNTALSPRNFGRIKL